jgi:hypothetical protein
LETLMTVETESLLRQYVESMRRMAELASTDGDWESWEYAVDSEEDARKGIDMVKSGRW